MLRRAVADHGGDLTDRQAAQIRASVDDAAAALRRRAIPLGQRLYAEKPKQFIARIEAYWGARSADPELEPGDWDERRRRRSSRARPQRRRAAAAHVGSTSRSDT